MSEYKLDCPDGFRLPPPLDLRSQLFLNALQIEAVVGQYVPDRVFCAGGELTPKQIEFDVEVDNLPAPEDWGLLEDALRNMFSTQQVILTVSGYEYPDDGGREIVQRMIVVAISFPADPALN